MPVQVSWGIRSKKSIKDGSQRSSSLQSTHQRGDEIVVERMFSCRFLEQIEQVASTTVGVPHISDIVGKMIQIANHLSEGHPQISLHG